MKYDISYEIKNDYEIKMIMKLKIYKIYSATIYQYLLKMIHKKIKLKNK